MHYKLQYTLKIVLHYWELQYICFRKCNALHFSPKGAVKMKTVKLFATFVTFFGIFHLFMQKLANNDLNDFLNKVYFLWNSIKRTSNYYFLCFKCRKSNANLVLQLFQKSNAVLHYFPYFQIVMHYTAVLENSNAVQYCSTSNAVLQ